MLQSGKARSNNFHKKLICYIGYHLLHERDHQHSHWCDDHDSPNYHPLECSDQQKTKSGCVSHLCRQNSVRPWLYPRRTCSRSHAVARVCIATIVQLTILKDYLRSSDRTCKSTPFPLRLDVFINLIQGWTSAWASGHSTSARTTPWWIRAYGTHTESCSVWAS